VLRGFRIKRHFSSLPVFRKQRSINCRTLVASVVIMRRPCFIAYRLMGFIDCDKYKHRWMYGASCKMETQLLSDHPTSILCHTSNGESDEWYFRIIQSQHLLIKFFVSLMFFKTTQPGHPLVGRRNEYQPKGDDALRLGSNCLWFMFRWQEKLCDLVTHGPYMSASEKVSAVYIHMFFTLLYTLYSGQDS